MLRALPESQSPLLPLMSSELFPEVGVLILASRILVGGGVLNKTEGSLVSFLAPGGACSHESHVLTCQHGELPVVVEVLHLKLLASLSYFSEIVMDG